MLFQVSSQPNASSQATDKLIPPVLLLPPPPHTLFFLLQRARELASGAKPTGTEYLPYTPLRAKRGVSTPLMVAAAARPGRQQQTLSMQPVPPVQVKCPPLDVAVNKH